MFCKLLKLLLSVVKAAKQGSVGRFRVWLDNIATTNEIKPANLFFVPAHDSLKIKASVGIFEQANLSLVVLGSISCHGGTCVDLDKPWLKDIIEEYIKPVQLKAVFVVNYDFAHRL